MSVAGERPTEGERQTVNESTIDSPVYTNDAWPEDWPKPTADEALQAADDFVAGLIDHANVLGYYDPEAGEVSSRFVLMQIRAARCLSRWQMMSVWKSP